MEAQKSYCDFTADLDSDNVHKIYHDTEYGFPVKDDSKLFERLILEINQAGLSWETILKKKENFRKAYSNFNIKKIAGYNDIERNRLLNEKGIVRNRLKVDAAIFNANVVLKLQKEFGSFKKWLDSNHPGSLVEWTRLFKKTFKFTGGEIVKEFLMSTGYLKGAHIEGCPVHKKILKLKPRWVRD